MDMAEELSFYITELREKQEKAQKCIIYTQVLQYLVIGLHLALLIDI